MFGRPRSEDGPRSAKALDEDGRRAQRDLVGEVRAEAQRRGVDWEAVVEHAGLAKASRSRLRNGVAGLQTIGRLRRAIDEMSPQSATPESPEVTPPSTPAPSARRWVVVQRRDRQLYYGIASSDDDEIATTGRVRLERCRPIQSPHSDAAALAVVGPAERGVAGAEVPSALILEVAVVYDCTRAAVKAFESRK